MRIALKSHTFAYLWTKIVNISTYFINISPSKANNGYTQGNVQTCMRHLRIYGCLAYVHVRKAQRNKVKSKTIKYFKFTSYN
jgi:hypothetical protein